MAVTGNAFDFSILKRILSYVKPYKKVFYFTALVTVLLAFLSPIRPFIVQYAIDNYVIKTNPIGLLNAVLIMLGVLIIESLLQFSSSYYANFLGQNVIKDLRVQLYKHILNFKSKYFDNNAVGTLVTRTISDIQTIVDVFSQGFLEIIGDILKLIVIITVMFVSDWRLSIISLSTIPILLIATNIFKNAIKKSFQDVRNQVARLNAFVQEHITGMMIVQIFNKEHDEFEKFKAINEEHKQANIRSIWHYSVFFPVVEILSAISIGLLVWWGSKEALKDTFTLGSIVSFIMYVNLLFRPIRQLADRFNTLQMGMVSSERVFKILDAQDEIKNLGKIDATNIKGKIEFKNVWFAYIDENWVLKNISFTIEAGQTIALVGATGSGKSTIINLINRSYEINKGEILIDDIPLQQYDLGSLRQNVGMVLQDVFLFSDTIKNNITLNNPLIKDSAIEEASKIVGADNFIKKLPLQFDYNVMERGATLSVGQRQLLAFVRSYVYNPKIFILDEATSSIDTESEQLIQKATEIITKNRSSIVVAHRLSTIQKADKIYVMQLGEILESGSHNELLQQNGHYKNLFNLQYQ